LPSSQVSAPRFKPSPQIGEQTLGAPKHIHPVSIWQMLLQPSPLIASPSSQVSPLSKVPLPQTNVQTLGSPLQLYPPSM
jgi:hypothetical protein